MRTIEQIRQLLLDGSLRDDQYVELKSRVSNKDTIARSVVGIANSGGGYLVLGVRESPYGLNVTGLDREADQMKLLIESVCREFKIQVDLTFTEERIDGKVVLMVGIAPQNSVTYYSRSTSPERLYTFKRDEHGRNTLSEASKTYQKIYKYMTLECFMLSLYTGSWRFFEPNKWPDKYERRFYCADYQMPHAEASAPKLFATCLTREKNSEASWKVYAHGEGLNRHCVQLEIDIAEFRNQLDASGLQLEERKVVYCYDKYIEGLHQPADKNYSTYFKPFTRDRFIALLALKRKAYEYEKEVRFFLIPRDRMGERSHGKQRSDYKDISIDFSKVIKSVRVDKHCSPMELKSLQQACFAAGINPDIKKYKCIESKHNNEPPKDAVSIPFELFCIDDMKGSARLKIK